MYYIRRYILVTILLLFTPYSGEGVSTAEAAQQRFYNTDFVFNESNKTYLKVSYKNQSLGEILSYQYLDGAFLPLLDLSYKLGFNINVNADTGLAEGWIIQPNRIFVLNIYTRELIVDGKTKKIPSGLAYEFDDEIYVDASLIPRLFPIEVSIDQLQSSLEIIPKEPIPFLKWNQSLREQEARMAKGVVKETIKKPMPKRLKPLPLVEEGKKETPKELEAPVKQLPLRKEHDDAAPIPLTIEKVQIPDGKTENKPEKGKDITAEYLEEGKVILSEKYNVPTDIPTKKEEPRIPVQQERKSQPYIEEVPAKQVKKSSPLPQKITSRDFIPNEDNLMIFQMNLGKFSFEEYLEAYTDGTHYYLPLGGLSQLLDIAVDTNVDKGAASGWIIKEDKTFLLDTTERKVHIKGEGASYSEGYVIRNSEDIFVESSLLSQWFPIDFDINPFALVITVNARDPLPVQMRIAREEKWKKTKESGRKKPQYEIKDIPYEALSSPFISVDTGYNYSNNASDTHALDYSIRTGGDVGYLNTKTFLSGDSTDGLNNLRIKAGRKDHQGRLLGKLNATSFAIGDVEAVSVPLIESQTLGRGIHVSNRPLNRPTEFDVTSFTGDAIPGWEVELYRNGALLDFQFIDSSGRYEFLDVAILYGTNTFRLVFYGPQGQIREEIKNFNIGSSVLQKGEWQYQFSADEKAEPLIDVGGDFIKNDRDGVRVIGNVEYGLSKNVSLALGAVTSPVADAIHNYVKTAVRTTFGGTISSLDFAYDTDEGQWATKFTSLTAIDKINIKAEQRLFSDKFISEDDGDFRVGISELDLNTTLRLPFIKNLNTGLNFQYEDFDNAEDIKSIRSRLSTSMLGVSFSNNIRFLLAEQESYIGDFSVRGHFDGWFIRTQMNYTLNPEQELDSVNLSAQRRIGSNMDTRLGLQKNLSGDKVTILSGALNWDRKKYKISTQLNIDDNKEIFLGTRLSFSLGKNPYLNRWEMESEALASSAGVIGRAFLDGNQNDIWDEGEEALGNVKIKSGRTEIITDEAGKGFGIGILADYPTDIVLDDISLEDPLWIPAKKGYTAVLRPGVVTTLDFPVVAASEIDGIVYLVKGNTSKPQSGVTVELIDEKGTVLKTVRSEFDGFYLIDKVLPGNYTVRASQKDLDHYNTQQKEPVSVTILNESDFYSGYDILLNQEGDFSIQEKLEPKEQNVNETKKPAAKSATIKKVTKTKPKVIKHYSVQLGAYRSREEAEQMLEQLTYAYGTSLLQDVKLHIKKANIEKRGIFYRLRTETLKKAESKLLCNTLQQMQEPCFVAVEP